MNEFVTIEAAAEGGKPKVKGVAYSGGKMSLPGWKHPVVVDLSGMEVPESVPLLTNHENRTGSRVGMVAARVESDALHIEGEIVSSNGQAAGIVEQAEAGADWQLSIGAEVKKSELVKTGTRVVNGQEHAAPFYHVTASVLREVSVVAVGADQATRMQVAASFTLTGEVPMHDQNTRSTPPPARPAADPGQRDQPGNATPDPGIAAAQAVAAERERIAGIQRVCAGEFAEIEREAVNAGWTVHDTGQRVLAAIRAARPMADVNVTIKRAPALGETQNRLEAAMCLRVGLSGDDLVADYGEAAVEAASQRRHIPLVDLLRECVRIEGQAVPQDRDTGLIQAAFSTVSLPGILSNVAHKRLLKAFTAQPLVAPRLCSEGDLNDFKENERFRLTDVGDLMPVAPDGEIKDGGVREDKATNQLDTFGKKFVLTRKMIINDDLNAFMKFPISMGNRAARLIDQLFFARLLLNPTQADGKKLFATQHGNLLSGTDSELSHESLARAVQLFLDQADADGQPISVEPRFLLVPTPLRHEAIRLTRGAALIISGGDATSGASPVLTPALNALADENLVVISSPYLTHSGYPGASASSWFLFGDPAQVDTFEIGYLRGKRTPTIDKGNTDYNTLGMWFRVIFDLGIREQDWRGMVRSDGE
jgi:hypothetical protein